MIEFLFTIDYEIYGNGAGALGELVYEPTERLREVFRKWEAHFVAFVEVAELERIEACGTDAAIAPVKRQVRELYDDRHEVALHLHPQWCNAGYEDGRWVLDHDEYNLCTLSPERIREIVERSLAYLRYVLRNPYFVPLSFRAGNWLFQPTHTAAAILAENSIKIDSSVFKGGVQHNHHLDYRRALRNGYYWRFSHEVSTPDPDGSMIEVPIYTEMVAPWRILTSKRVGLQNKAGFSAGQRRSQVKRAADFLRLRYPLKLDFCRMTLDELTSMMETIIRDDRQTPAVFKPVVAIGHTKDLTDLETVDAFLAYLRQHGIPVSTFNDIYPKLVTQGSHDNGFVATGFSRKIGPPRSLPSELNLC